MIFRRTHDPLNMELQDLTNQLPLAILVVETKTLTVLAVNPAACQLLKQDKSSLLHRRLPELFEFQIKSRPGSLEMAPGRYPASVRKPGEILQPVLLEAALAGHSENNLFIYVLPYQGMPGDATSLPTDQETWERLQRLSALPTSSDLLETLTTILKITREIVGASFACLYLVNEKEPCLKLEISCGDELPVPEQMGLNESVLTDTTLWLPGRRTIPINTFTTLARTQKLSYLASLPLLNGGPTPTEVSKVSFNGSMAITNGKACTGLLVLADRNQLPPPFFMNVLEIANHTIQLHIQLHSQRRELQRQISKLTRDLYTYEISAEHIQEAVIFVSTDLRILRMNTAAVNTFGYQDEEAFNQPVEYILIGNDPLTSAFDEILQRANLHHSQQLRLYRRNGDDFLANLRILPVLEDEALKAIVCLVQDLSEKEQIRVQTEQLEQRASLGEVTTIFAHEVRNPINNISTGLQLMQRSLEASSPLQDEIGRLLQDCDRLEELMKSVLHLVRPKDYTIAPLDLGQLIRRVMDRSASRMRNAGVTGDLQLLEGTPFVLGDTRALEQVFNNLINNAVQAMTDTGGGDLVIKVRPTRQNPPAMHVGPGEAREAAPRVEISVADTGPGIPAEIQDKIFQPFFTTRADGTGLGLAVTKRIITFHRGTIRLESFLGGTIFFISLPAGIPENQGERS